MLPAEGAAHRAAMRQALGERFVASCASSLSPAQVSCALGARDDAAVAACTGGAAP